MCPSTFVLHKVYEVTHPLLFSSLLLTRILLETDPKVGEKRRRRQTGHSQVSEEGHEPHSRFTAGSRAAESSEAAERILNEDRSAVYSETKQKGKVWRLLNRHLKEKKGLQIWSQNWLQKSLLSYLLGPKICRSLLEIMSLYHNKFII